MTVHNSYNNNTLPETEKRFCSRQGVYYIGNHSRAIGAEQELPSQT